MKKINKITNIALIFMLIGVVVCQNLGYARDVYVLRVPVDSPTTKDRQKKALELIERVLTPTQQDLRDAKQKFLKGLLDKEKIKAYENTLRLIRDLKDNKIPVGVGTMSINADTILTRLGIRTSIDIVVNGNDVRDKKVPGKPSGKFYLEVAKRLAVDPRKTVVVEDSIRGVRSAVNGKFGYIIGLARNEGDYSRLKDAGADIVLKDIGSLSVEEIIKQFTAKFNFNGTSDSLEAVIFDMDGVICNIEPLRFIVWKHVFDRYLKWREKAYGETFKEFNREDYSKYAAGKGSTEIKAFLVSRGINIPEKKPVLDKTVMRSILEELRKKVDVKLEEFDRVAVSPEERLDSKRAIKRIKNVFTIGKLLMGLDAELFKQYVNDVAEPMLELDAGSINFILASRIGNSFSAMSRLTKKYPPVIAGSYLKSMIERKELWGNKFYYLPGLPIVVEAEGLSDKYIDKLNKVALLIVNSGWLTIRPETLSYVESIRPEVNKSSSLSGHTNASSRGINISIRDGESSESIAITIIHEGTHKYVEPAVFAHEDKLDSKKINRRVYFLQHEEKTAKRLLHELYAYGAELQFRFHLIKVYKSKTMNDKFIDFSYSCMLEARKLISALEEIEYRKDSVNTAKELWNNLSVPIKRLERLSLNRKIKFCL